MKVKDLLEEIKKCQKEYGKDFLEWEVFSEQCTSGDKKYKRTKQHWWIKKVAKDSEDWEYFHCAGFNTKFPKDKIFTVNVNY